MCSTGTCVDVIRADVKCVGVRYVCVCHMSRHDVARCEL